MTTRDAIIAKYYAKKLPEYNEKYNLGYYTHIHTGLYNPSRYPALYSPNQNFTVFGLDRLRHLLVTGQENLTHAVCQLMAEPQYDSILDCGCGHGGNSIYLAENYAKKVLGVTLSSDQKRQAEKFVREAGRGNQISIYALNILTGQLPGELFDAVLAVDSLCQVGSPDRLFARLTQTCRDNSILVISDNFIADDQCKFKERFDTYWESDISNIESLLIESGRAGFEITSIQDRTDEQLPFWKLSIAYTTVLLDQYGEQIHQARRDRMLESKRFHEDLVTAFCSGTLHYYGVVLKKQPKR